MAAITAPSPVEIAEVLDAAVAHMERVGWHQGYLYDEAAAEAGTPTGDCPTCAAGAILTAVYGLPRFPVFEKDVDPRARAATRMLEHHVGGSVPEWNDDPDRTQEQVVGTFRETAAALREGATA